MKAAGFQSEGTDIFVVARHVQNRSLVCVVDSKGTDGCKVGRV